MEQTDTLYLSPWWRHTVILVLVFGLGALLWITAKAYRNAAPIPELAVGPGGETVFTGADIRAGQQVFLKYGLMENGTVWGHGAYLGPDFPADYLHALTVKTRNVLSRERYRLNYSNLTPEQQGLIDAKVKKTLKANRYDSGSHTLTLTSPEAATYYDQVPRWKDYFSSPTKNYGLQPKLISDQQELRQLTAFFAWAAWASVANRPGTDFSYTNNFPYEPAAGNTPTADALLWSALSLVALLGVLGLALFAFGRFNFLGWKGEKEHAHPEAEPGAATPSQRATLKYFVVVSLLFLAQVLVGAAVVHYRADPGGFYGLDISRLLPSNLVRIWHLQLAIFWIATAYVAGGLFLAPALSRKEPRGQAAWVNVLFVALVIVVGGSLFGEALGINNLLGKLWFWLGNQGWEYLDLGRAWQFLLAVGLILWLILLLRCVRRVVNGGGKKEVAALFLYAAAAIPIFYLPAFFFGSSTHFTVVDTWRFWIIHLWVEGFFELFVTVMVAIIFFHLGVVSSVTARRVIYLDAILFLGSGIIGTAHHWYWTGQSTAAMAMGAVFSAMEVVPLTLLTLDAWDFIRLTGTKCDRCEKPLSIPHKWTFYFLIAVGVWNFLGAGIFGFLINLPIVSYYEVGTMLTPNHGHAAMMGVFGMLAVALTVFSARQLATNEGWKRVEKYIAASFWGLNIGLLLMVVTNLFPGGVVQLLDVIRHGYWHARSPEFLQQHLVKLIEWARMPADLIFIFIGVVPLVIALLILYFRQLRGEGETTDELT